MTRPPRVTTRRMMAMLSPPPAWGRISSLVPRAMGGNLDNKELGAGAKLYLPVFVPGALFSCGDGHGEMPHRGGAGAPSVTDLPKKGDIPGAHQLRDLDFRRRFERIGRKADDLRGLDTGVVECGQNRRGGEFRLGILERFRKGRLTDTDDGSGILHRGPPEPAIIRPFGTP